MGKPEVQGAHIYPKGRDGSDDLRNGICLCRRHHWAMDAGWISIFWCAKICQTTTTTGSSQNTRARGYVFLRWPRLLLMQCTYRNTGR
jgi:predicted restriction endonuclease